MLSFSLQSGSNGNSIYVEAGGVRLLFDAGISGKQAAMRMQQHGRDIRDVDALIISHDHNDHVRSAGIFQRKYGLPIYLSKWTYMRAASALGKVNDVRHFHSGERIEFGSVIVHTFRTPHDAADGVSFVVQHENRRLGILTDLGHPFSALQKIVPELDACYLESNYDPEMLETGPYSFPLKQRIRSPRGHISNKEAATLLKTTGNKLQWATLAHLSEQNNDPELALQTHRKTLGQSFPLHVASRYQVSDVMNL
jgi:phosphoribosyl 1,2-cyclic phosphodiesterase